VNDFEGKADAGQRDALTVFGQLKYSSVRDVVIVIVIPFLLVHFQIHIKLKFYRDLASVQ
jgi:hypothetical protein